MSSVANARRPEQMGPSASIPCLRITDSAQTYRKSFAFDLAAFSAAIVCVFVVRSYLARLNRKLDQAHEAPKDHKAVEKAAELEGTSVEVVENARRDQRYSL